MLCGDYEGAWREGDGIRGRAAPDPHRFWQGEPLAGQHVILRCLHGFGDTVQMLRYLPRLHATAARVVLEVPPRMVKLAACFDGVDEVVTWGEDAPAVSPKWTVQVEVMELPYLFRTTLPELPMLSPSLSVPPAERLPGASLQVGIMASAGDWNPERAVPLPGVQAMLGVAGCTFWDLRGGEHTVAQSLGETVEVDPACRGSLEGLAARIAALDLVITADTVAAHLAGAMGVRAWVMLQFAADWRWMQGRDDSPWYPSVRLFRQPSQGDWESVQQAVTHALAVAATEHARHEA